MSNTFLISRTVVLSVIFLIVSNTNYANCQNVTHQITEPVSQTESYVNLNVTKLIENKSFKSFNKTNIKPKPLSTGNELWDGLIQQCLKKPSFSCIQKNVYSYLDDTLNLGDVNVTDRFVFKKNSLDFYKYTKEANEDNDTENEINDNEGRAGETPIEEVTNSLYGKGVNFMMTHDVEMKMPDMLFDGATFRIQPRSIEGNGALVKIEFLSKYEMDENKPTGRIFLKRIKKFFQNKLLLAFLAIVLIIKIIKIKLFWLLPLFVGVGAAKKLVLKFVLFLFPALSQIFKLCSWYHHNYHQTKFHHHSHHINHLHTIVPPPFEDHHHTSPPHGAEVIFANPPRGHPVEYIHGVSPPAHSTLHAHEHNAWDFSGPGLGSEYIGDVHRNTKVGNIEYVDTIKNSNFKPKLEDLNEISAWGLGSTVPPVTGQSYNSNPFGKDPRLTHGKSNVNAVYQTGNTQKRNQAASNIAAQYNSQGLDMRSQEALRIQQEQKLVSQQQRILNQQTFAQDSQPVIDSFYSPILVKMDKIFSQLGILESDEGCKERLVCSLYKNPTRYSPHSNYISNELSRDSSELQKPLSTNTAVVRFYRYVQAARDGQDQQDCLQMYAQCAISTEK